MMYAPAKATDPSVAQVHDRRKSAKPTVNDQTEGQFDDCDDDVALEMPSHLFQKVDRLNGSGSPPTPTSTPNTDDLLCRNIQSSPGVSPSLTESREEKEEPEGESQISSNRLTKVDVLSGRGGGTNNHAGNRYFRHLCDQRRHLYVMSKKMQKREIAKEIVADVRARGGRFLKRDDKTGEWQDIGEQKAISKTSQALREGLAQKMRQALVTSGTAEQMRLAAASTPPSDPARSWPSPAVCSGGCDGTYAGNAGMSLYTGADQGYNPERIVSPDRTRKMPFSDHDAFNKRRRMGF